MSPLKPSISSLFTRRPKPRESRQVCCSECGNRFEISRRAVSIRCPRCTTPLKLEDITIRNRWSGTIATAGHVLLDETGTMDGELTCGQLTIVGRYHGTARVHGSIELAASSHATGHIHAQSIVVKEGASFSGHISIGRTRTPPQPKSIGRNDD